MSKAFAKNFNMRTIFAKLSLSLMYLGIPSILGTLAVSQALRFQAIQFFRAPNFVAEVQFPFCLWHAKSTQDEYYQ